jgi:NAD(P)-dependent dehydrogenase (short-subunit alcohol dehydrogenase family)
MSEALCLYLMPQGVAVSCVCPAGVRTSMPERMTHHGPHQPMGTPALPVVMPDDFLHRRSLLEAGGFRPQLHPAWDEPLNTHYDREELPGTLGFIG